VSEVRLPRADEREARVDTAKRISGLVFVAKYINFITLERKSFLSTDEPRFSRSKISLVVGEVGRLSRGIS
jgi:hypothetical protein